MNAVLRDGRFLSWGVLALTAVTGCARCGGEEKGQEKGSFRIVHIEKEHQSFSPGIAFRLDAPAALGKDDASVPMTVGRPLSKAKTKALLAKRAPLPAKKSVRPRFAFRQETVALPSTDATSQTEFPPTTASSPANAASKTRSLQIERFSPQGKVTMAERISVTFSQPMIPVNAHGRSSAAGRPVRLEPAVAGRWRWVGTRTLVFEPAVRLPMATRFRVTVDAAARSVRGQRLAQAKTWRFETPPPTLVGGYPSAGRNRLDPVFFLLFDQQVDPQAVVQKIRLKGSPTVGVRLAEPADLERDPQVAELIKKAPAGRFVIFVADQRLKPATAYTLEVKAQTPSAEGPLKTSKVQKWSFKTHAPFALASRNCTAKQKCRPLSAMELRFNNSLDEDSIDAAAVAVTPELPDKQVRVDGRTLTVRGRTRGRTTYTVTLPPTLRDTLGQKLSKTRKRKFYFREARTRLDAPYGMMTVLDPAGEKALVLYTINQPKLKMAVYRVGPQHWADYLDYAGKFRWSKVPLTPPGALLAEKVIAVKRAPDSLVETRIPLKPYLNVGGYGQFVVQVSQWPLPAKQSRHQWVLSWIQVTDLALDAFVDHVDLLAWATRLRDGAPLKDAEVLIWPDAVKEKTDKSGMATLHLPVDRAKRHRLLVAHKGADTVLLPRRTNRWAGRGWHRRPAPGVQVRWYVFDDRKLYRPGEKLHLKGWLRAVDMGSAGTVKMLPDTVRQVRYTIKDSGNEKLGEGTAALTAGGGFDLRFEIPAKVNLGRARVELVVQAAAQSHTHIHRFRIAAFKRRAFAVDSDLSAGPHFVGGHTDLEIGAQYATGDFVAEADVAWRVAVKPKTYVPPRAGAFTFGDWRPSWIAAADRPKKRIRSRKRRTDARGRDRLRVHFDRVAPRQPLHVKVRATVTDRQRRSATAQKTFTVHPAALYVGLKTDTRFVQKNEPLTVKAVVTDVAGHRVSGRPVAVTVRRQEFRFQAGSRRPVQLDAQHCTVRSRQTPVECRFKTVKGGTYIIEARVKDKNGRENRTGLVRWVSGDRQRGLKRQKLRLVADKPVYRSGEAAQVLVLAPFCPAEGLLTIRRGGLVRKKRFTLSDPTTTLKIPLGSKDMPGVRIAVDLVGAAERRNAEGEVDPKLPKRPAFASATQTLKVSKAQRRLHVDIKPQQKRLAPGGQTRIDFMVRDHAGKPVSGGELAVVVVDEARLALTGDALPDPLAVFYPLRAGEVRDHHLRGRVVLPDPRQTDLLRPRRGAARANDSDSADDESGSSTRSDEEKGAALRSRPPTDVEKSSQAERKKPVRSALPKDSISPALFAPSVKTDARGKASLELKLPDQVARYRIMTAAVAGPRYYGRGEETVTARKPLRVQIISPRFLRSGDRIELPVVVHNQTATEMKVDVAVQATRIRFGKTRGRRIVLPAHARREVRFDAEAVMAGNAHLAVAVAGARAGFADTDRVEVVVRKPVSGKTYATYGTLGSKQSSAQTRIKFARNTQKAFGGLRVSTSSTAVLGLTDALFHVQRALAASVAQVASRLLATAAFAKAHAPAAIKGLLPFAQTTHAVKRDLKYLSQRQGADGGFPFWQTGNRSWPFVSAHVTHALVRAKNSGYTVPTHTYDAALRHLRSIEAHIPGTYSERLRWSIVAYTLYVRALTDDIDTTKARQACTQLMQMDNIPLEGLAWLYPVIKDGGLSGPLEALRKLFQNRVRETASTAHFRTAYKDRGYLVLHSKRRVDAIVLEGLLRDEPRNTLIPKLVEGLLKHRTNGRWANTQEDVWVLLALGRYFETREKKPRPAGTVRLWLGTHLAAQHVFDGRLHKTHSFFIPMKKALAVKQGRPTLLTMAKTGQGPLYYRIGMRVAKRDAQPVPQDRGFAVSRRYEAVDDPAAVQKGPKGVWQVRRGARVRVVVTFVAHADRYHVALVDPLPAGLEPLHSLLLRARPLSRDKAAAHKAVSKKKRGGVWARLRFGRLRRAKWFGHEHLRAEKAEAFAFHLPAGVYRYRYVTRALTPGTFVIPPPQAKEIFHLETFSRGPAQRMVIR